jgi:hypothetical protein
MVKRTRLQVAALVAGAALIAGCGSGSPTSPASTTPRSATTGSAATSAPGRSVSKAAVELSTCSSTAARSRLSPTGKVRFLTQCRRAVKNGSASVIREAAQQCAKIIKQTVPAAAQASLIADCPKS